MKIIKLPSGEETVFADLGHFYIWCLDFKQKSEDSVIIAAIGRPTAPVYPPLKKGVEQYWKNIPMDSAIEYGELQGEKEYRIKIAKALSTWYKVDFEQEHILFTVGGRMGLSAISYAIRTIMPNTKVVAALPVYPDYKGLYEAKDKPTMVYVDTLEDAKLTSEHIKNALKHLDPKEIGAFIFCDPNNPMGYCVGTDEWQKISHLLEIYPNAMIVLDEAYAELVFDGLHVSLLSVSPHLKNRIILLRSATKGFSASGERMAIVATWNDAYMEKLREYHFVHVIHAPKSGQYAYSHAMACLEKNDLTQLAKYYEPEVRFVENLLKELNFLHNKTPVEATFYVIADFKEFLGKKISTKTASIYPNKKEYIEDDVDIAFHLLAEYGLGIMPLSLFEADAKRGLLRITCSFTPEEQKAVSDKLRKIRKNLNS